MHARAVAHHLVIQIDFFLQVLVFLLQLLPLTNIFPGQVDQARDRRNQLQMVAIKGTLRAPGIEVNHPAYTVPKQQRHTQCRPHSRRLQAGGLSQGAPLDVVQHQAGSFRDYPFQQGPADSHRNLWAMHAIPRGASGNLSRVIEEKDRRPLRRNDIEQHAEQLPLQAFLVSNTVDFRGDFQNHTQVGSRKRSSSVAPKPAQDENR